MTREQAIERFCMLVTKVGEEQYKSREAHDCFCLGSPFPHNFVPTISEKVVSFIERAVTDLLSEICEEQVNWKHELHVNWGHKHN